MNRRLRSKLDLLYPATDVDEKVQTQQLKQKFNHDNSKPLHKFTIEDIEYIWKCLVRHRTHGYLVKLQR